MSTLKVNTIQNTSGTEVYTCKAWVNFNGTGTVAIRASGNVSSITDNGVGDYTVNFTTAMADANYSVVSSTQAGAGSSASVYTLTGVSAGSFVQSTPTTSLFRVTTIVGAAIADALTIQLAVFR